jgi:hypothetical protein
MSGETDRRPVIILVHGRVLEFFPAEEIFQKLPFFADPVISRRRRDVLDDPQIDVTSVEYFFSLVLGKTQFSSIQRNDSLCGPLLRLSSRYGFRALESYLTRLARKAPLSKFSGLGLREGAASFVSAVLNHDCDFLRAFGFQELSSFLNEIFVHSEIRRCGDFCSSLADFLLTELNPDGQASRGHRFLSVAVFADCRASRCS